MNWMDRYEISQLNVESAQNRLENAQMRYNEVVKRYGENSEETKKASNELQNAQNALDKANLRANSSMVLIGISALSMIPDFLKAGQALVTFATRGTIAIAGQTYTIKANTIAHVASNAATWAASGARAFLTTITSAATYKNIAHALSIGAVTAATWLWSAATWSVTIPLLAIEAPVWAIMLAIGGLILVIQDLYTWLTGGESVIGDFLGWLTSIDFSSVIETFKSAGKFLLDALLEGMTFGLLNTDRIASIFGTIRDYLPFSNAKVGPLSDLTTSGQRFIQTFSAGAESQQGYLSSILGGLFTLPEAALGLVGSVIGPGILPGVQTDTQQAPISQPLAGIASMLTGGTGEAPATQGGSGIVVNVNVTGNTISGDEGSLKSLAVMTASEFEKMLLKVLNQEAMRAGM
jgi:exonuclease VII small subunit